MVKSYLILVRHGESRWNIANKFTGWVDVPLSEVGVHEAMITARRLEDLNIDVAFTSTLQRAQETLNIILSEQKYTGIYLHKNDWKSTWFLRYNNTAFGDYEIPVHTSAKLNERYYGSLQGLNKDAARKKWGDDQVHIWRRSYKIAPPKGESLQDVYKRAVPHFKSKIMKHVRSHQNVLVAAHGNSLRAIIKYIENISDEEIPHLELQTGKPVVYEYKDGKLRLLKHTHSFDRPTEWTDKKKHVRGYTKASKKSVSKKKTTKKKSPIKKKTVKHPVKKVTKKKVVKKTAKKKASTKKNTSKKTPTRTKRSTHKKVAKKKPTKKTVKKKVAKRKAPTSKRNTTKRKIVRKKVTKKTTKRKSPAKKSRRR